MRIFNILDRINFIDINNVFVGFENNHYNEYCGYFFSGTELDNTHSGFNAMDLFEINISNDDLDHYNFDINYFTYNNDFIQFRLINHINDVIYLVLFNENNWYASDFIFNNGINLREGTVPY